MDAKNARNPAGPTCIDYDPQTRQRQRDYAELAGASRDDALETGGGLA
jgi:hypothetical protein